MPRTIHPHEILICTCIVAVLAAGLFCVGFTVGHQGYEQIRIEQKVAENALHEQLGQDAAMGYYDYQNTPLHINAECHNDASDWATIEMANAIGEMNDIPVFVHGNCLTHNVVDVLSDYDRWLKSVCDLNGIASAVDNDGNSVVCPNKTDSKTTNVLQPEGQ